MRLVTKKKYPNGKREIYFLNKKIFSYTNWRKCDIGYGLINYADLPITHLQPSAKTYEEKITLIYPVYYEHNDHKFFINRLKEYESFSEDIKRRLKIIIVDDCSKYPISLPDVNLNITLLRVDKNIKWNNPGARNLGACFADTEKIILADIDWLIPQATLQICLEKEIPNNSFIVFENPARGSVLPNIYCTKKQTFLRYGGYNESYRGFYGDDIFHRRKLLQNNVSFIRPNLKVIGLKDKILLDEHFLSRDLTKAKKVLAKNPDLSNTGNILQYPWHFEQEREYKQ